MAKFKLPKFDFSALKSFSLKSILPTKDQLLSKTGIALSATAIFAVTLLVIGIVGANSANSTNNAAQDNVSQDSQPIAEPSLPPLGPIPSADASRAAEDALRDAEAKERQRISDLGQTDTFLVAAKITMDSYLAAAKEVASRGNSANKTLAEDLIAASQKLMSEVKAIAKSRGVEFAKLGVEPSGEDLSRFRANLMLSADVAETVVAATDYDIDMLFENFILKSTAEFVDFAATRDMPDDEEFKSLIKLINESLGPIAKSFKK